jgi:hypothetical protein
MSKHQWAANRVSRRLQKDLRKTNSIRQEYINKKNKKIQPS